MHSRATQNKATQGRATPSNSIGNALCSGSGRHYGWSLPMHVVDIHTYISFVQQHFRVKFIPPRFLPGARTVPCTPSDSHGVGREAHRQSVRVCGNDDAVWRRQAGDGEAREADVGHSVTNPGSLQDGENDLSRGSCANPGEGCKRPSEPRASTESDDC
jgi:hypothetical protein